MGKNPKITAPPDGEIILTWYKDTFEAVFCILHPFIQVNKEALSVFNRDEGPTRKEVFELASSVSWDVIMSRTGIDSVSQLDYLLRQIEGSVEPRDALEIELLNAILVGEGLIIPERGDFSPIQLDVLFDIVWRDSLGHVIAGDEFGLERKRLEKASFLDRIYPVVGFPHPVLYTESESMFLATHWDSYLTLFCGEMSRIEEEVSGLGLEGFFCDGETRVPLTG